MPKDYPRNLPSTYERGKLSTTRARWNGRLGELLRQWMPRVAPGVPPEAHMGFASNGAANEDVGLTPRHAAFHELGYFGVEGGPYDLPAPNTVATRAAPNSWYRLHNDPRVVGLLGRPATMTPWPTHPAQGNSTATADIPIDDQVAIGIVNLIEARDGMRRLPASIAPRDPASLWATALSYMGWSNGVGGASRHIARYERQLAAVPESQRWLALVRAVAADTSSGSGPTYNYPSYSVLRTQQKVRVGHGLAQAIGGNVAWFGAFDDAAEDVIARRASSTPVAQTVARPAPGATIAIPDEPNIDTRTLIDAVEAHQGPSTVLIVAGFGAIAVGAYFLLRRR